MVMTWKFEDVGEWIEDMRATVRRDLDNLLLFTGPEGQGKSTVAFQVMRALDPSFGVDRAVFGIADFLATAPTVPRYHAVLADELEANNRRGMSQLSVDLLMFLKDCRGLNLHMGLCYPHEALFEGAILNHRVRWKVHVPRRGLFVVSERTERKYRKKSGEEVSTFVWVERGRWAFEENRGRLWGEYREKKDRHMLNLGAKYREAQAAGGASATGGVDHGRAVDFFSRALGEYEERTGPGAAIHELP